MSDEETRAREMIDSLTGAQLVALIESLCDALNKSLRGEGPLIDSGDQWTPLDDVLMFVQLMGRAP